MAGTISLSLSQQFDELGNPLAGGRLFFYRAGTTSTPQNAYYDAGLTLPFPNPYTLDDAGRIPQFFLADGSIKVVLIDRNGVTQINADNVLVIGPSGGGGGGGTVDPTTVLQTGWLQPVYGTGTRSGFVRANGRTIGSATSGATERANADTQALFLFLYAEDANLAVSGGRGASAAADWAANKTIALPDWRGRVIAGLDDMGNTAAGRLTSTYFGTAATVLGAASSAESNSVILTHAHNNTLNDPGHAHTIRAGSSGGGTDHVTQGDFGGSSTLPEGPTGPIAVKLTGITITNANAGTASAHNIVQPTMLATIYIKL